MESRYIPPGIYHRQGALGKGKWRAGGKEAEDRGRNRRGQRKTGERRWGLGRRGVRCPTNEVKGLYGKGICNEGGGGGRLDVSGWRINIAPIDGFLL